MKFASFMSAVTLIFSPWTITYEYVFKALDFGKLINLIISDTDYWSTTYRFHQCLLTCDVRFLSCVMTSVFVIHSTRYSKTCSLITEWIIENHLQWKLFLATAGRFIKFAKIFLFKTFNLCTTTFTGFNLKQHSWRLEQYEDHAAEPRLP